MGDGLVSLALGVAGCAVLVWPVRALPGRRRNRPGRAGDSGATGPAVARDAAPGAAPGAAGQKAAQAKRSRARRAVGLGAGVAALGVLLGWSPWAVMALGLVTALVIRLVPVRQRPPSRRDMQDCAAFFDLLAACLDAGMPIETALAACLSTLDGRGRMMEALGQTASLLTLGSDPHTAWQRSRRDVMLASFAGAAARSADGGVKLAGAARDTASDLRSRCRSVSQRRSARAGVMMTSPLALCFLPAFVCLGLAPVIISLVSGLHLW